MSYYLLLGNFLYVFILILGLVVGSFINAWVWRTRENFRIISGRSMCPTCRRTLPWYENIPVISFILLKGKCRGCRHAIPPHYTYVELATGIIFVIIAWHALHRPEENYLFFLRNILFATLLIITFVYDWLYQEIISGIIWLGAIMGSLFNYYLAVRDDFSFFLIGMAVGGGFFLFQFIISQGRWIGGGDIRLGIMMGLWLGWPQILMALFIAYSTGALWGIFLLAVKKKSWKTSTPFGTHLALATLVCLLWGPSIMDWYLKFLR